MPETHAAAKHLASQGKVVVLQGGKALNLVGKPVQGIDIRGVYRLRVA